MHLIVAFFIAIMAYGRAFGETVWHLGGDTGIAPAANILSVETDGDLVYLGVGGVSTANGGIMRYLPRSGRLTQIYDAGRGCSVAGLRKSPRGILFLESCSAQRSIKLLSLDTLTATTVAQLQQCVSPWDMVVEPDGFIVSCMESYEIIKVDQSGNRYSLWKMRGSPWCSPQANPFGLMGIRSIERSGDSFFVASNSCNMVWRFNESMTMAQTVAGVAWSTAVGSITEGLTNANTVSLPSYAVRMIQGKLFIGMGMHGFVVVEPDTSKILRVVRPPATPVNMQDRYAIGNSIASDGEWVWVSGLRALMAWRNEFFQATPTPVPPTETPTLPPTETPTIQPTDTPASALPTATPTATSISRACELAQELVNEVCR